MWFRIVAEIGDESQLDFTSFGLEKMGSFGPRSWARRAPLT